MFDSQSDKDVSLHTYDPDSQTVGEKVDKVSTTWGGVFETLRAEGSSYQFLYVHDSSNASPPRVYVVCDTSGELYTGGDYNIWLWDTAWDLTLDEWTIVFRNQIQIKLVAI